MSLFPFTNPKSLISSLKDPKIEALVCRYISEIDTVAKVLSIDPSYLSVQLRLLLPFYDEFRIFDNKNGSEINLIREVLTKLRSSLGNFETHYLQHRRLNGIIEEFEDGLVFEKGDCFEVRVNGETVKLKFDIVPDEIGFDIQNNLHYIHKSRSDTKFHLGIFLENKQYPICYCSVSLCDRNYQANSLSKVIGSNIPKEQIYVLTRSFGFTPLPHNMMSKLFDYTVKYIKYYHRRDKEKYPSFLITALNPFLGFNGGIFLGSNFTPFATSPMEYKYNEAGLYLNRRNNSKIIINQQYQTPPIVWLANPLTKTARKQIEASDKCYSIGLEEYKAG